MRLVRYVWSSDRRLWKLLPAAVLVLASFSRLRNSERWEEIVSRRLRWEVTVLWGSSVFWSSAIVDDELVFGDEARSEVVWVAMSRWKSSVGSEAAESVSSESEASSSSSSLRRLEALLRAGRGGIVETFFSSFSFSVWRFWWAVSARSWRAVERVSSIGVTTYWLRPYMPVARPAAP